MRAQAGPKSVNVYPVNYVASSDFGNRIEFARTVVDGVRDAGLHVEATAANCPNTKIVLGGFSQGAALAGYVTAAEIPEGVPAEYREFIPNPMPSEVADHVAAVVLIGQPSPEFMRSVEAPPVIIGPSYTAKTLKVCAPADRSATAPPLGHLVRARSVWGQRNGRRGSGLRGGSPLVRHDRGEERRHLVGGPVRTV